MINLLGLALPWWAKWAAIAALVAVTNGVTWTKTRAAGEARLDALRAEVDLAGKLQAVRVAEQVGAQRRITEGVVHGWDQAVKDLRSRYERGPVRVVERVREPAVGGGIALPAVSDPARAADGDPTDGRLADCAETTLMLVRLQEWVRAQQAVMPP